MMDGKEWLWLSNLVEILQDELRHGEDRVITSQEVSEFMNDEDEEEE